MTFVTFGIMTFDMTFVTLTPLPTPSKMGTTDTAEAYMEVVRREDILDKAVKCGHCKRKTVVVCTVKTIDANGKTIFTDICTDCREKLLLGLNPVYPTR